MKENKVEGVFEFLSTEESLSMIYMIKTLKRLGLIKDYWAWCRHLVGCEMEVTL